MPVISVVCPVLNEITYINQLIAFYKNALPADKEIFFVDGGSTDGTIEALKEWEMKTRDIHLLINENKYVPFALNMAIEKCKGNIIVRLDAHTVYAEDYFVQIVNTFANTDADIVGGPMRAAYHTSLQAAVAYCTSSVFGVGNSKFHDQHFEGYTDSVYLGAWKHEIFSFTGMFDTEMLRNQDDEFHYRAQSLGYKIYLNPRIKSTYYPRKSYRSLFTQYFQYGLFKPTVLRKVKAGFQWRHIIPALFVIYLVLLLPLLIIAGPVMLLPLALYFLLAVFFSSRQITSAGDFINRPFVFFTLHFAYGSGFCLGMSKRIRNYILH